MSEQVKQESLEVYSYSDAILQHMSIGVALFDADNFILLAASNLFHTSLVPPWQDGRAIGHTLTEWLPDAEATGVVDIFRRVAETGTSYHNSEYAFPSFERGMTYWNWTLDPIRNSSGRIVQLLLTATDITEQVQARKQIEAEKTSLSQATREIEADRKRLEVVETVAQSVQASLHTRRISAAASKAIIASFGARHVYIHTADPTQQLLRLLYMYPPPDSQVLQLVQHIPYNSSFPSSQAHKRREPIVIEDLQAAPSQGILASDNPLVQSGARGYICIPLWFDDRFEGILAATFQEAIHTDGPQVQALAGCAPYIAAALAHARLHAEVENERARLRAILDQLPEGIIMIEAADGHISYANTAAATILGISLTSLNNASLNQKDRANTIVRMQGLPVLPRNFAIIRALSGETTSGLETTVLKPDGTKAALLISSAPLHDENGLITGAVLVFQDITAQKSIEQQKNEFLSFASHELRTPVTAIQGYAEILQAQIEQDKELGPQSLRALSVINEQSQQLSRLIDEMLDLTRIDNMQLKLHREAHDLIAIVARVVETQASMTRKHRLHLVLEGIEPNNTLIGYVDKNRLAQIVNNLVSNAIKYSPSGGDIEVGVTYSAASPHEVTLWVKDHGTGIPASELPHIFNRFHRASTIDHSISGLGIGLYLVKELVKLHGGRIWAESIEGSGSTFYVQLPLKAYL